MDNVDARLATLPDDLLQNIANCIDPADALCAALASRRLARCLTKRRGGWRTHALSSPSRLEWACRLGYKLSEATSRAAASQGLLAVLVWARQNGAPWSKAVCEAAAAGGHLALLQWARQNGCPWDDATRLAAEAAGHASVAAWARDHGCRPLPGPRDSHAYALPQPRRSAPGPHDPRPGLAALLPARRDAYLRTVHAQHTPSGRRFDELPVATPDEVRRLGVANRRALASLLAPALRDGRCALSQHQAVADAEDGTRRQVPRFPIVTWNEMLI